jgi:hypothetical protein
LAFADGFILTELIFIMPGVRDLVEERHMLEEIGVLETEVD